MPGLSRRPPDPSPALSLPLQISLGRNRGRCSRAWGRLDGMARCKRRAAAVRRTGRGTSGCASRERRRGGDGVGAWAGRIGVWRVEL
jgi:hypothetical protein